MGLCALCGEEKGENVEDINLEEKVEVQKADTTQNTANLSIDPQSDAFETDSMNCTENEKVDRFTILSVIGRGTQGTVFLSKDEEGAFWAIKRVKNKKSFFRSRGEDKGDEISDPKIRREVEIMSKLDHPNLVRLKKVVYEPDISSVAIVMEYIDGETLMDDKLQGQKPLTEEKALDIFRQLLKGLEFLHYSGIVHRDIKPSNLLLTKSGLLKIADYGVSMLCEKVSKPPQTPSVFKGSNSKTYDGLNQINEDYKKRFEAAMMKKTGLEVGKDQNAPSQAQVKEKKAVKFSGPSLIKRNSFNLSHDSVKLDEAKRMKGELYPPTPMVVKRSLLKHADSLRAMSGTFAFFPPEAFCEGNEDFSGKVADVWAAGVSLFLLLYGRAPFLGETNAEVAQSVVNNSLVFPPTVDICDDSGDHIIEAGFKISVSEGAKLAVGQLLHKTLSARVSTVENAKAISWVSQGWKASLSSQILEEGPESGVTDQYQSN